MRERKCCADRSSAVDSIISKATRLKKRNVRTSAAIVALSIVVGASPLAAQSKTPLADTYRARADRIIAAALADSAAVTLNDKPVERLFSAPFEAALGSHLQPGRNTLVVEVTNLAANRIADLDRRSVQWKSFHEVNFVNKDYKSFDASKWPLRDSGLFGPVRLIPLKQHTP